MKYAYLGTNIAALTAINEGRAVERYDSKQEKWRSLGKDGVNDVEFVLREMGVGIIYRPKPEPKVRDWSKPQDIPGPGPCYIRSATVLLDQWSMVVSAGPRGFQIATDGGQQIVEWEDVGDFRHSTDLKTWRKCEVTEESE